MPSLHSLRCLGPTACSCRPIIVLAADQVRELAADDPARYYSEREQENARKRAYRKRHPEQRTISSMYSRRWRRRRKASQLALKAVELQAIPRGTGERERAMRQLADEAGISLRTLQRYARRAS